MTTQLRETKQDRSNQERLFIALSEKVGCQFKQFQSNGKYRIDGYLYNGRKIIAWIECKWYNSKAFCGLNVPKYEELVSLSERHKIPSYLLIREGDKWGAILIHDGEQVRAETMLMHTGGTPPGRKANPDDIEPIVKFENTAIKWGGSITTN